MRLAMRGARDGARGGAMAMEPQYGIGNILASAKSPSPSSLPPSLLVPPPRDPPDFVGLRCVPSNFVRFRRVFVGFPPRPVIRRAGARSGGRCGSYDRG
jgi:hypothetical protein